VQSALARSESATASAPAANSTGASAIAASAPTTDARIYAINELPEDVRRTLPRLTVGGSIYSENAASRFLIINGQIFHEGDELAPELRLEHIKLKSAVLRYKAYRYSISY
jgi:general secretion pathway protein B